MEALQYGATCNPRVGMARDKEFAQVAVKRGLVEADPCREAMTEALIAEHADLIRERWNEVFGR